MKIEIWNEKEKKVRLRLVQHEAGGVDVVVVDKNGEIISGGHLLYFTTRGTIWRCKRIKEDLPFQLDSKGRIKIDEVDEDEEVG